MFQMVKVGLALVQPLPLGGCWVTAAAQDYPAGPVKIIVPFGAGGPADVYARIIGQHLQESAQAVVRDREPPRRRRGDRHRRGRASRRPTATRC